MNFKQMIFLCLFCFTPVLWAQELVLFDSQEASMYKSFRDDSHAYIKSFTTSVIAKNILKNNQFYISGVDLNPMSMDPFGVLEKFPGKIMDCEAVYCKDIILQQKINAEMEKGRLVLLTHAWNGYIAAAIKTNHSQIETLYKELGAEDRLGKSLFIVTPKTTLDTLHHELFHAEDHNNQDLNAFLDELTSMITGNRKGCNQELVSVTKNYVKEMRAYNEQEQYLLEHTRNNEYSFEYTEDGIQVLPISGEDYKEKLFQKIQSKKAFYNRKLNTGIENSILTKEAIKSIMDAIAIAIEL